MMKADPHRFDDLFASFGPITLRRFFGGEGVCAGEIMFAMIFDDCIYFKTNERTRDAFLAENCEPFTFQKASETIVTSWYAIPNRLYDDPDELSRWAQQAFAAAAASETLAKKQGKRIHEATARQPVRRRRSR
jgi:DNA transformation protein